MAAARALVARVRGHVAYEHHTRAALEGEDTALVLHEHGAARGGAPCKLVTAPVITGAALRGRAGVRFHELYHAPGAGRCGLSAELAPFHGAETVLLHIAGAAGHHEVAARLKTAYPVVRSAPVSYDCAVKAPAAAEDVCEQTAAVRAVLAVQAVVGAHDGGGLCLLHGQLEAAQVYLAERPLVHRAVRGKALVLLVVAGEVLETGARALGLDALDEGGGKHAREQRVLGEVFEVPAAERAALYVGAWAEHEADALRQRLPRYGGAYAAHEFRVPAAGGEHRRGKTGRRLGAVHAEHVPGALLLAQAVRPVRHHERAKAKFRHGPRVPAVRPLAEPDEFKVRHCISPGNQNSASAICKKAEAH